MDPSPLMSVEHPRATEFGQDFEQIAHRHGVVAIDVTKTGVKHATAVVQDRIGIEVDCRLVGAARFAQIQDKRSKDSSWLKGKPNTVTQPLT